MENIGPEERIAGKEVKVALKEMRSGKVIVPTGITTE